MLNFRSLRAKNVSRCHRWFSGGLASWSLSDWGVAFGGEAGEALDAIKKLNRDRIAARGNRDDAAQLVQNLADELADTVIYADLVAAYMGIDLGEAVARKFNKISEKHSFPERLPQGDDGTA